MNKNIVYAVVGLLVVLAVAGIVLVQGGFSGGKAQITSVVTTRSIDAQGNAVGSVSSFDRKKDNVVYAVFSLKNATNHTKVGYIRYYNGKYVDSKVTVPTKSGANSVYFAFEKGVGMYPAGTYKLVAYIDGKRSLETTYTFQ